MTEHSNVYRSEDGTEVEIKIKAECPTQDDARKALSQQIRRPTRYTPARQRQNPGSTYPLE